MARTFQKAVLSQLRVSERPAYTCGNGPHFVEGAAIAAAGLGETRLHCESDQLGQNRIDRAEE